MNIINRAEIDINKAAQEIFTSPTFWGAIVASISIITIGIIMSKIKIIRNHQDQFKQHLNNFVVLIALPAAIYQSYMSNLSLADLSSLGYVLLLSVTITVVLHVGAILTAKYFPKLFSKKAIVKKYLRHAPSTEGLQYNVDNPLDVDLIYGKATTEHRILILITWLMIINNSVTFFGLPMVQSLFGAGGAKIVLIFQIPAVIATYSIGSIIFSKVKFNKDNFKSSMRQTFVNPMMIALISGVILWLTQLIPGASGLQLWWQKFDPEAAAKLVPRGSPAGWFNLEVTLPPVYRVISLLGGIATPLIWIITGLNISKLKVKAILKDRRIGIILLIKYVIWPTFMLAVLIGLTYANTFGSGDPLKIGTTSIPAAVAIPSVLMILFVTPTTPVFTSYAVKFKNHEEYVSPTVGITALFSSFMMPLWFIIGYLVFFQVEITQRAPAAVDPAMAVQWLQI